MRGLLAAYRITDPVEEAGSLGRCGSHKTTPLEMKPTKDSAAVVVGASGGIGSAIEKLLIEGDDYRSVYGFARSRSGARHIDLLDEASIAAAADQVGCGPAPGLVVVATGLLHADNRGPEKALRDLDPQWLAQLYAVNAIGPALVAKHFLPMMPKTERVVFAALSARVASIGDNRLGGWHGYRASKAALNMLIRNFAIEERRRNEQAIVVALHPGTVNTELSRPFQGNVPPNRLFDPRFAATQLLGVIQKLNALDSGRLIDFEGHEIPF